MLLEEAGALLPEMLISGMPPEKRVCQLTSLEEAVTFLAIVLISCMWPHDFYLWGRRQKARHLAF